MKYYAVKKCNAMLWVSDLLPNWLIANWYFFPA